MARVSPSAKDLKTTSTPGSGQSYEWLDQLKLPAAHYQDGKFVKANPSLYDLLSNHENLDFLAHNDRLQQAIREVEIGNDNISFELTIGSNTYRCTASPIDLEDKAVAIFFEDISAEIQSEKNNALLYRLTLLFSSTQQPIEQLLQMAVDQLLFEQSVFDCSILLFNKKEGTLKPVAWGTTDLSSSINGQSIFRIGEGIAGHVAATLKPVVIRNILTDSRFVRKPSDIHPMALLCVPLSIHNQLLGVLCLSRRSDEIFTDREVQFFATIGNRLALVIDAEQSRTREAQETQLIQTINSSLNTETKCEKVAAIFADMLSSDICLVFKWDKESKQVSLLGQQGIKISQKAIEALRTQVKPAWFKKQWTKVSKPLFNSSSDKNNTPQLIFPLVARDVPLGFIVVQNSCWDRNLTEKELLFGSSMAGQLAISLDMAYFHEEVLEERNQMQQVLDSLRDGVVMYTPDWNVALYNLATKRILGIKREFIGMDWNEALNQSATKYSAHRLIRHFDAFQFFEDALKKGKTSTGMATLTTNPPRLLEIATGPVYDRNKKVSGVLSHARDITQVNELQQKMAARVQQLTYLFKISSASGFNSQGIVRRILRHTMELFDVQACQIILTSADASMGIQEIVGDEQLVQSLSKRLEKQAQFAIENADAKSISVRKSKDQEQAHILTVPIMNQSQRCLGALTIIDTASHRYFSKEDINILSIITSQIAAKLENINLLRQIEEDRNKLAAIIEQSVDGILVTDAEGRVTIWNTALERLTGIPEDMVKGKTVEEARGYIDILERNTEDNLSEIKIKPRNSSETKWLGIAYAPIKNNQQQAGYIAIIRDISRQKELERSKNEFVSTASHELRSPITAIVGYLSMLKRGDAGAIINKQQAFFVDKAYQNAKRMVMLIEDILMTTRVETGQMRYQIEPIDIIEIIDGVLGDLQFKADEKSIGLHFDRNNATMVFADRDGIHQVISNIVTNAIKYTPNKGQVYISFHRQETDGKPSLVAEVKDTGVGIDPSHLEKVFEKFARIDNPLSVSAGGTGLGLYITKSIVDELGGKIWAESQKDKGTSFFISLPIAKHNKKGAL